MAGVITCCYGCVKPKRHEGCHGTCKEFKEQQKKHNEIKAKREAYYRAEYARSDMYSEGRAKSSNIRKASRRSLYA